MAAATLITVNSILKEIYEGRIQDQLNEEYNAMKRLEKSSDGITDTVGGKYVTFPIRVQRNTGISYRAEETPLAAPGNQAYAAVQVKLKYGYGRIRLSGQAMELADSNFQAFASALDEEMNRLKDDLAKDSNRIAYGNRLSNGAIAFIMDAATSASHVVDGGIQYLQLGEAVDVLVAGTGVATGGATNVTITSIVYTTSTVTFSASMGPTVAGPTVAGHAIYRTGNRGQEPEGIASIVNDTGLLHGVDPATQPLWAAIVNRNAGVNRPLSEALMIKTCDDSRRNGGKISVILTSLGVRRSYFNLLTQQRRFTDTKSFPGGFQGLPFNYGTEVPVVEDVDAPTNQMFFLDESKWKIYRKKEWAWADDDNSVLKWIPDYDSWQAMMRKYWQVGITQRNANANLGDITES
jgi:hypothetical protein